MTNAYEEGPRLELGEEPRRYCLDGQDVIVGDELELWTPHGWLCGEFEWDTSARGWARLVVTFGGEGEHALIVVLRPGLVCRWAN